jgi:hypothetical protein
MSLATCFDPLSFPYVRAQTYVDLNPPAVLAEEFYNPVQDALARAMGADAGYSTTATNDEFVLPVLFIGRAGPGVPVGSPFGTLFAVYTTTTQYDFGSTALPTAGAHGVYRIQGFADGNRGAGHGFGVQDALRYLGTFRWLFRSRVRVGKYSTLAATGLAIGLGDLTVANFPTWIADNSGFWQTFCDSGSNPTTLSTAGMDGVWITLWIGLRDADGIVRFYYQRDGIDTVPQLADTYTLTTTNLTSVCQTMRYIVNNTAVAADYVDVDSLGMICER